MLLLACLIFNQTQALTNSISIKADRKGENTIDLSGTFLTSSDSVHSASFHPTDKTLCISHGGVSKLKIEKLNNILTKSELCH